MKWKIAGILATYVAQLLFFAYYYRGFLIADGPTGSTITYHDPNWAVGWWMAIPLTLIVAVIVAASGWFRTSRRSR
jgi:hypothetical protein